MRQTISRASLLLVWLSSTSALAAPPAPEPTSGDVVDGVVQRYLHTPYGDVNGLRLVDGLLVLVAPPMAPGVRAAAPPGAHVRIVGQRAPDGALRAAALVNLDSGRSVDETSAPLAPAPVLAPLERCEAAGVVELVLHGPRGEANGVILRDGSIVYFRPDLAPPTLAPGVFFVAVGIGTQDGASLAMEAIVAGTDRAVVRAQAAAATVFNRLVPPASPPEGGNHVD